MSKRNCLPSQKLCHHLNQGSTLNDILMRAAHWMTEASLVQMEQR